MSASQSPTPEPSEGSTVPSTAATSPTHTDTVSDDPRYRSRVRMIEPTQREQQQQAETRPYYSSSSSDSESDTESPAHQGEERITSRNSNTAPENRPSPFQRGAPEYRSVELHEREGRGHNNVQSASEFTTIRLRARPNRVVWEPEFQHKETKKKASKAIKNAIKIKPPVPVVKKKEEKVKKEGCFERFKKRFKKEKKEGDEPLEEEEEKLPADELSPEMEKANSEGYNMMKKVFFPSIPALLQDLWVYLELAISIAAFGIGLQGSLPSKDGAANTQFFEYFYFILATIALFMALLDGFIYFFQVGSCARGIRFCISAYKRHKRRKAGEEVDEDDDEDDDEGKSRCGMSASLREKFNTWFELARNLINEFLVYPLLICDLFDYISEGQSDGYLPEGGDAVGGADFSFFVIGSFYLLLAVYIMRVVMVFGTLVSLIRLPSNKEASGTDKNNSLLIKFCIHIIGQILVHFIIIMVLATKIRNENNPDTLCLPPTTSNSTTNSTMDMMDALQMPTNMTTMTTNTTTADDDDDSGINSSPFLIVALIMGGILPLCGVAAFFIVNYFWMREFSIGFWLNMLSMLQGASFAETVFGGEGLGSAEEQANQFLDDSGFDAVKSQITRYKENSFWTKFFYPTRVPYVALAGVLYDLALVAFIATLMLRYDEHGVRVVVFCDDPALTSTFVMATVVILAANIHVLLLLNFLLLVILLMCIAACLYSIALIPIVLFIVLPMMGLVGYFLLFRDTFDKCGRSKKHTIEGDDLTVGNPSAIDLDQEFEMDNYNGYSEKQKEAEKAQAEVPINLGTGNDSRSTTGSNSPLIVINTSNFESVA